MSLLDEQSSWTTTVARAGTVNSVSYDHANTKISLWSNLNLTTLTMLIRLLFNIAIAYPAR